MTFKATALKEGTAEITHYRPEMTDGSNSRYSVTEVGAAVVISSEKPTEDTTETTETTTETTTEATTETTTKTTAETTTETTTATTAETTTEAATQTDEQQLLAPPAEAAAVRAQATTQLSSP